MYDLVEWYWMALISVGIIVVIIMILCGVTIVRHLFIKWGWLPNNYDQS